MPRSRITLPRPPNPARLAPPPEPEPVPRLYPRDLMDDPHRRRAARCGCRRCRGRSTAYQSTDGAGDADHFVFCGESGVCEADAWGVGGGGGAGCEELSVGFELGWLSGGMGDWRLAQMRIGRVYGLHSCMANWFLASPAVIAVHLKKYHVYRLYGPTLRSRNRYPTNFV